MSLQTWVETLKTQTVAGSSFGTFTTAKTVIPTDSLYVFPAGYFTIGKMLEIDVMGGIGTLVTTPGTMVFQVMLGAIIAFTTGNIQLNATAHTNLPFWLKILLTTRAVGSGPAANFMGMAALTGIMFTLTAAQTDGVNSSTIVSAPATAPAVGANFDSTVAQILDFFVGFSISSASNTIQVQQYCVKSLN